MECGRSSGSATRTMNGKPQRLHSRKEREFQVIAVTTLPAAVTCLKKGSLT